MNKIAIEERFLNEIITIIEKNYPKALVWAYGSRIDGTSHAGSDFDIAIKDFGQDKAELFVLKNAFQESNIPFLIDIFEFDKLPESFKEEIQKNHVVLYNGQMHQKL